MQIQTIILQNVSHYFYPVSGPITILDNQSIVFKKGRMYAITGHSGVGKSTLLHLLSGLEDPTMGTIAINDTPWARMTAHARAAVRSQSLGIILQKPFLLPDLNVIENCMIQGLIAQQSVAHCMTRARELLALVDIADKENEPIYALSGGQQQRLAVARALFAQPDFILADEPTSHLDAHTKQLIITLLLQVVQRNGVGLIINTHDEAVFSRMDQVYTLHNGHLIEQQQTPRKKHEHTQISY